MTNVKIAVLMTCYNRVNTTLKCLESLFFQENMENIKLDVFLVDDNSSDNTAELVSKKYVQVTIVKGTGNLYWGGGMHKAWITAMDSSIKFDYYLWLNDDTYLYPNAIPEMTKVVSKEKDNAIVCGALCDEETQTKVTYSGHKSYKNPVLLAPNGENQKCDFCNGNLVLIPNKISSKVGIIDPYFRHFLGDYEYSARAVRKGFSCCITPSYCGTGNYNTNDSRFKCFSKKVSLINRFRILYSPKGVNPFREFRYFKSFSCRYAIKTFFELHILTLFPRSYKRFCRILGF